MTALLLVSGPALARPHGSPDLTPTVFLPRHPDFELLSFVGCLSGPCAGDAVVAQAEGAGEQEPAPPVPAPADALEAGPAAAQGAPQQRILPAEPQAAEVASPALAAGALGAARQLLPGTAPGDEPQTAGGGTEFAAAEAEAGPAGVVVDNATLVPKLPTGGVAENTAPEGEEREAGDLVVASLPETVDLGAAGETEQNAAAASVEPESTRSGLMSLRGRQAALDEALGVGGFGQNEMLGLRRLSLTSPGTIRADAGGSRPPPPRTALRDLVTRSGPVRESEGPMDSDERQAVHRHALDRRPEPTEVSETQAPTAPFEPAAPIEPTAPVEPAAPAKPAAAPTETAPAEPRAPAAAPGAGGSGELGGAASPVAPMETPG